MAPVKTSWSTRPGQHVVLQPDAAWAISTYSCGSTVACRSRDSKRGWWHTAWQPVTACCMMVLLAASVPAHVQATSHAQHQHWGHTDAYLLLGSPTSLCWSNAAQLEAAFPSNQTHAHSTRPAPGQAAAPQLCSLPATQALAAADAHSSLELLLQHAQALMPCGQGSLPACEQGTMHSVRMAFHAAAQSTLRFYIPPGDVSHPQLSYNLALKPLLCGQGLYEPSTGKQQASTRPHMPARLEHACSLLPGLLRLMGTIAAKGQAVDCRWDPTLPDLPGKSAHPMFHPSLHKGARQHPQLLSPNITGRRLHGEHPTKRQHYLVAFALHNKQNIMPHFIQQVLALVTYLPPGHVLVSCYESGSGDDTPKWLHLLQGLLDLLHIPNHFVIQGTMTRGNQARIAFLASIRNMVLAPLYDPAVYAAALQRVHSQGSHQGLHQPSASDVFPADKIIYINDPFFSWQDLVRLLHYNVDLACGMDFYFWDNKPAASQEPPATQQQQEQQQSQARSTGSWWTSLLRTASNKLMTGGHLRGLLDWQGAFYDIWVTRDMNGNKFVGGPSDEMSRKLLAKGLPHPVQCCWNAAAVINAAPFRPGGAQLPSPAGAHGGRLQFRAHAEGECPCSECTLMCNDFWKLGHGRMLLDPSVRLSYEVWPRDYLHSPSPVGAPMLSWRQVVTELQQAQVDLNSMLEQQPTPTAVMCCPLRPGQDFVNYDECYSDPEWLNKTKPGMV